MKIYKVGGAVRDRLLGITVTDWTAWSLARPLKRCLPKASSR